MKFKVDDKIRVRTDLELDERYDGETFVGSMEKYCGQVFTVKRIREDGDTPFYELDGIPWAWTDGMLELFEDREAHKFEAFLREVVDGNTSSTGSNWHAYHLLWQLIDHDDSDAECFLSDEEFETVISDLVDFYTNKFVPKEDEPAVKMTLSEVEKALGHKVKIVKEEEQPWN